MTAPDPEKAAAGAVDTRTGLRAILSDVAGFAGSQYVLRFATMIKGFIVARVLGPAGNGLWQHYSLIFEYGQHGQLGLMEGYNKRIGHRLGSGEEADLDSTRATGLTGIVLLSGVLWVVIIAVVALRWDRLDPIDRWALPMLGLLVVLEQLTNVYKALLRAYGRIPLITSVQLRFAFANLVLSLALLPGFEMLGLMAAWLITRTTTTAWLIKKSGMPLRFGLIRPELVALVSTGFPIWIYNLTKLGLRNVDRVLVDSVLDRSDLGIYGLAVTLSSLVRYSADSVGFVLYPIYLRLYGETRDPTRLRDHLEKPTAFLALLVPTVLGLSYLVLHLPVIWFLPGFEDSIEIFRLLTVAIVFSCLSILPGFFLMAINRQNWLVPLGLGAVAFNYLVGLAAVRNGLGLPGVAAVTAGGLGLHTTCVLWISGRHARGSRGGAARFVLETYLPVAYVAGLVVALRLLVPRSAAGEWSEVARASLEGGIFLVLSVPLLAYFEKRTGFIAGFRRGRSAR